MPPDGATARAEAQGTLARVAHELATAPELGELLESSRGFEAEHPRESFEASVIRVTRREYEKNRRVPADLRAEMTRAGSIGYQTWLKAREACDYEIFRPQLERLIELTREYVACHEPYDDPYDPLLDDHEPGMKTAEVEVVFDRLRDGLVEMVAGLGEPVDDSCLFGDYPVDRQRAFSLEMLEAWGMDDRCVAARRHGAPVRRRRSRTTTSASRRGSSPTTSAASSPASTSSGTGCTSARSTRATSARRSRPARRRRSTSRRAGSGRTSSGAASRRGGTSIRACRRRSPSSSPTSRSRSSIARSTRSRRARSASRPTRSRTRSTSSSASSSSGSCSRAPSRPADLPEAFDAKLRDYLGVQPKDVVEGVLQDVHWSATSFGYFPTYALGNVISIQLWERAVSELGDVDAQFEAGEFGQLREWLGENVHHWGQSFEPPELLERSVGGPLDAEPYLAYLRGKLEALDAEEVARR